eukprot:CAMPEP_0119431860 /NCGR_PEP_ID=MMETSP1335-20130426/46700_1 /TAXON_ID=259385 /ORGANISM="Chrysoculter rhomboideus, Strain RCC1486" /LENGTH=145 /DNA_ID=CAMNT_0007457667 /DNA_START=149 /DNA_END=586 /DNA_ORIENTATION=+
MTVRHAAPCALSAAVDPTRHTCVVPLAMWRSEVRLEREDVRRLVTHDTCLLVLADTLLEEVRLALQRDHLHPVEGVGRVPQLGVAQCDEQAVRAELNVLRHQLGVHADQVTRERVSHKHLLVLHRITHDVVHSLVGELLLKHRVE